MRASLIWVGFFLIGLAVILVFEDHQFALYIAIGVLAFWVFGFWVSSFFDEPPPPARPLWQIVLKGLWIYTETYLWFSLLIGSSYLVSSIPGDSSFLSFLMFIGVLVLLCFRFKPGGSTKALSDQSDYGLRQEPLPGKDYDLDGGGESDGDIGGI